MIIVDLRTFGVIVGVSYQAVKKYLFFRNLIRDY